MWQALYGLHSLYEVQYFVDPKGIVHMYEVQHSVNPKCIVHMYKVHYVASDAGLNGKVILVDWLQDLIYSLMCWHLLPASQAADCT